TVICQWGLIPMLSLSTSALMCWGAGIAALGALVTAVGGGYWHIVVGFGVNSVGLSLLRPGNAAGMSLAVGPADQGRVAGAMGQIGGMFGFSAVFVALHTLHPALPYWIFVVTLAGLAGYTILNPALNGQRQPARA
ncbi:MAG: MFS transporter, partial [Hyphomonadaceae bacterium]